MTKKLVLTLTGEALMAGKDMAELEAMGSEEFDKAVVELKEELEDDLNMALTSYDVRIVDTEEEVVNKEYTPSKISIGMLEETKGVHIHLKGEPGELEVEVVSDLNTKDMTDLFIAILQDMIGGGAE